MTVCGLLLVALTLLYPWLLGRSVEKYAADYEPFDMWVEFRDDGFRCSYCEDDNAYSDITAIKENDPLFLPAHQRRSRPCFERGVLP